MNAPLAHFFHAGTTKAADITNTQKLEFMQLQAVADMMSTPYLKPKTIHVFEQPVFYTAVKSANGKLAGHCLLADITNVDYVSHYPGLGKSIALTALFVYAGHGAGKGSIPPGMGPTSTLFKEVENFAMQNDYATIVAKTNINNANGRCLFERMGFTPSSPFIADNEDYTSMFYVKELTPNIGQ